MKAKKREERVVGDLSWAVTTKRKGRITPKAAKKREVRVVYLPWAVTTKRKGKISATAARKTVRKVLAAKAARTKGHG